MQPVTSIRSMRVQRNLLKQQLYKISILAATKHQEVLNALECFLSERSLLEIDLDKSMKHLVELKQLKQQAVSVISQYNFFHNQLIQRGAN